MDAAGRGGRPRRGGGGRRSPTRVADDREGVDALALREVGAPRGCPPTRARRRGSGPRRAPCARAWSADVVLLDALVRADAGHVAPPRQRALVRPPPASDDAHPDGRHRPGRGRGGAPSAAGRRARRSRARPRIAAATRKGTITATYWNWIEYWGNQSARTLMSTSGSAPGRQQGRGQRQEGSGMQQGAEVAQAVVRSRDQLHGLPRAGDERVGDAAPVRAERPVAVDELRALPGVEVGDHHQQGERHPRERRGGQERSRSGARAPRTTIQTPSIARASPTSSLVRAARHREDRQQQRSGAPRRPRCSTSAAARPA